MLCYEFDGIPLMMFVLHKQIGAMFVYFFDQGIASLNCISMYKSSHINFVLSATSVRFAGKQYISFKIITINAV